MNALLGLGFILSSLLVLAYDPSISNGTCYYGPNEQAASNFIPCGNAAGGVQSCCQVRDICLSSNACFNGQYFVTYLAGCTDESYEDSKCPDKGAFSDQQWTGLVRCFVSNTTNEEWGSCEEPIQPNINRGNTRCTCDADSSTAVFTDAATLTDIASLPVSAGNAIAWESGFQPSTIITDSTATTSSSTATMTTGSGSNSNTPTPGSSADSSPTASPTALLASPSSTLSTATKAGIGAGTAGGVLAIGAILLALLWHHRRKNKTIPPIKDQIRPNSLQPWGTPFTDKSPVVDHKSWGGKSELPTEANEITTGKTSLGENAIRTGFNTPATTYQPYQSSPTIGVCEIDGSPAASTSGLTQHASAYEKPQYQRQIYEMPG